MIIPSTSRSNSVQAKTTTSGFRDLILAVVLSILAIYLCCILSILYSGSVNCTNVNDRNPASTALSLLITMIGVAFVFYFIGRVGASIMDDVVHVASAL
jgi:hypothetical protein